MQVKVVSYTEAQRLHKEEQILNTHNVISLLDTGLGSPFMRSIYQNFPRRVAPETLLTIHVDDISKPNGYHQHWTPHDALRVREWFKRVSDNDRPYLVHCWMGVSRSGAVGTYLAWTLDHDMGAFFDVHPEIKPNFLILKSLLGTSVAHQIKRNLENNGRAVSFGHE